MMNQENFYVFVEEGGAGRAIIAKACSQQQAARNIQAQIGSNPRFAEGATQAFRSHDLLTRSFADNKKSNVVKFERREPFVEKLLSAENGHDKAAEPKAGPVRFFHEGPFGKVGISFNDRTLAWQAHCCPEGGGGREVTLPLTVTGEEQAAREAVAILRDEAGHKGQTVPRPTREEAAAAVKTLIAYAGDNPEREGLLDTPKRVVKAFDEFFAGYNQSAWEVLQTSFSETGSYDEMVILTDIEFESHCEHHMVPFVGKAHVAYFPDKTVVGISKLARLVEVYASRLQIQEKMTTQIADNLNIVLQPRGVAVVVEARHMCMTMRGVKKKSVKMVTSCMTGIFREDAKIKSEFMAMIGNPRAGQS